MPLCHKQSRRSRDAPILELAPTLHWALQRTHLSIQRDTGPQTPNLHKATSTRSRLTACWPLNDAQKMPSHSRSTPYALSFCGLLLLCCCAACALQVVQQPSPTDPAVHAKLGLPVPANPKLLTLFLVGDSTVRNGRGDGASGQWGWGEPLVDLFDTTKINVVNRAIGGRSSRTYITEGHWADTLAFMKPGDVVLFQFGHNDSGPLDDTARARGTLPGVGDDTRAIDNPILKRNEVVHTYGWYMRQYVAETIARGATPILCSPIPRKIWKDGKVVRNAESYGGWARQIAVEQRVAFIDLDQIIGEQYDAIGEAKVEPLFADPHTHTNRLGAELNVTAVITGLKALPHDPLSGYFSARAATIQPYRSPASTTKSTP